MNYSVLTDFLLWNSVINIGLLLFWLIMYLLAGDWMFTFHSRMFRISREKFDAIHYTGMAIFKVLIFVFNLVPYVTLLIIT